MIQPTKEDVLQALINSGYDIIAGWAPLADNPHEFIKKFIYEIARNELLVLTNEFSIDIPRYIHPISAIKKYRSIMCNVLVYSCPGEVKPSIHKNNEIELRHWKCRYHKKCAKYEIPICIRSYGLGYAIDIMSNGKFSKINKLNFSNDGKCSSILEVNYVGNLLEIPQDEVVIDERTQKIMTREQAVDFGIKAWIMGIESAVDKLLPEHTVEVLSKAFSAIGSEDMNEEEMEVIDLYIGAPISRWTKGLCVYSPKAELNDKDEIGKTELSNKKDEENVVENPEK